MNRLFQSIAAIYLLLAISGCGGSSPPRTPEPKPTIDTQKFEEQSAELLDLKSTVIILQSEIIELKSQLATVSGLNEKLSKELDEKDKRLNALESGVRRALSGEDTAAKPTATEPTVVTKPVETAPEPVEKAAEIVDVDESYKRALEMYFNKEYRSAISLFEQMIEANESHGLADNAQYWIGESYYGLAVFDSALTAFEAVLTFPQSNKNDYAQFKIGLCLRRLGQQERADAVFESFLVNYPESELFERVKSYIEGPEKQ